jgi:germination protein M
MANKKSPAQRGLIRTVIIAAFITLIGGIILLARFGDKLFRTPQVTEQSASKEVDIYFSSADGEHLKAEKRRIRQGPKESEIKEVLTTLLKGPVNPDFGRTMPDGTRVLDVSIKGRTAFADFSSEIIKNHPGGSSGEFETVYSIVNTITLNFPEIKDVQILVEGKKEETLAGHIDISIPLAPDRKIIS